jgi:FAD/FMN-containing dehydrogenase
LVSSFGVVEWLILMVLDLRKMRKVEIDIEKKSVTGQGGCVAADLEKPLEGNFSAPFLVTCVS